MRPQSDRLYPQLRAFRAMAAAICLLGAALGGVLPDSVSLAQAPASAITIFPGETIQAYVDAYPPGTAFLVKSGMHRLQSVRPKTGNKFFGEAGTIMNGATRLTSFYRSGSYWVAPGQAQQGVQNHGMCQAGYPRCSFPEDLFLDDAPLLHVDSLSAVGPGKWYFDYATDQVFFADDPTGRRVELGTRSAAFYPTADYVHIEGLNIRKYANIAQHGAIDGVGRVGWIVVGNIVALNHGAGIRVGANSQVLYNRVVKNGQLGVTATGAGIQVVGNEISGNNRSKYWSTWEAGGTKFVNTTNLVVRNNYVHHNGGPGLWTDVDNIYTLFEGNTVDDNERMGIFVEIGYNTVIRNNTIRRNGFGHADYIWGAGILVAASPNVEIYGNLLDGNADGIGAAQQNRGWGTYGAHEISNLWVHDNVIRNTIGWTGLVQDIGDPSYFTSRNNRFERNQYLLKGQWPFAWMNGTRNENEWVQFGQDVSGSFTR